MMDAGAMKPASKRVYIHLPKKYISRLENYYELDHGLIVKQLNPYINEGYIQAYFREWGTITACKIKKNYTTEDSKALAYVRFSRGEEADMADWAGPHFLGGKEVEVRRVVSPKGAEAPRETTSIPAAVPSQDAPWGSATFWKKPGGWTINK